MNERELFEKLADIEHQRWSDWQKYMHSKCKRNAERELTIPSTLVQQWERQINTPYSELSEIEKHSDRDQVKRYWDIIKEFWTAKSTATTQTVERIGTTSTLPPPHGTPISGTTHTTQTVLPPETLWTEIKRWWRGCNR